MVRLKPKCEDCHYAVGWTRYIQRTEANKAVLCWSCAFKRSWARRKRSLQRKKRA